MFRPATIIQALFTNYSYFVSLQATLDKPLRTELNLQMKHGQIHHLEYYVNDLELSNSFWSKFLPLLAYQKSKEWNDGICWTHENGTYLVFVRVKKEQQVFQNNRQASGVNHLAFHCDQATYPILKSVVIESNFKILLEESDYLCFEDSNKFAIELYSRE